MHAFKPTHNPTFWSTGRNQRTQRSPTGTRGPWSRTIKSNASPSPSCLLRWWRRGVHQGICHLPEQHLDGTSGPAACLLSSDPTPGIQTHIPLSANPTDSRSFSGWTLRWVVHAVKMLPRGALGVGGGCVLLKFGDWAVKIWQPGGGGARC